MTFVDTGMVNDVITSVGDLTTDDDSIKRYGGEPWLSSEARYRTWS